MKKGTKIHNRVRKVREDTLLKLYYNIPIQCQSCCYNSNCSEVERKNDMIGDCVNYKKAIGLNVLIEMMKESNIDIDAFCDKYKIKKEFFTLMIKGKMLITYRYYVALCTRLHVEEFDEFYKYKERFLNDNENDNNTSENGGVDNANIL